MAEAPPREEAERAERAPPAPVEVALSRGEFDAYNWAFAFERPIFPFLLYTFTLLAFAGLLGVWPAGRAFASAALLPLVAYALYVWQSSRALWARHPEIAAPRGYTFKAKSYLIAEGGVNTPVAYRDVARVLETRGAFYLLREGGGADVLPKRVFGEDVEEVREFLKGRVEGWKRSSFL